MFPVRTEQKKNILLFFSRPWHGFNHITNKSFGDDTEAAVLQSLITL